VNRASCAIGAKVIRWWRVGPWRRRAELVLFGAAADVGVPTVAGIAWREAVHQQVAHGFGEDRGGCDGLAADVAVYQRPVLEADLGKRQAVDQDSVRGLGGGKRPPAEEPRDRPAHRERTGDSNVEPIDLSGRRRADREGEGSAANRPPEGQLIGILDRYDFFNMPAPVRRGLSDHDVLVHMETHRSSSDPGIYAAFLRSRGVA
jgi:hypothetical protein